MVAGFFAFRTINDIWLCSGSERLSETHTVYPFGGQEKSCPSFCVIKTRVAGLVVRATLAKWRVTNHGGLVRGYCSMRI